LDKSQFIRGLPTVREPSVAFLLCDDAEVRSRIQTVVVPTFEAAEFADELRRMFDELGRLIPEALTGECSPPLDVFETDDAVEIVMDLPAVDASAVRIVAKGSAVLIAGEKLPRRSSGDASFHLVERGFGRFARLVRLTSPCDTGRARAVLADGELRVTLPKIQDRRGRTIPIQVEARPR
jgi:HSP20 family protein